MELCQFLENEYEIIFGLLTHAFCSSPEYFAQFTDSVPEESSKCGLLKPSYILSI
ncbi:hypothetical protein RGQ29_007166 [Quercus rubra]|uniref:Uncharacterized protein n=1 Tax=Quercus rubra TaxID=3512 RepID=A0AAN7I6Q5_QUERU|nr:hypothetical protein RGQ29_007166 [Quercus rubra]